MPDSHVDNTRFLLLTVSPSGDAWYRNPEHAEKYGAKPSASDPAIVRANGNLDIIFEDRDDIPVDESVAVADGVTATRMLGMPIPSKGDVWLTDAREPRPCTYPMGKWEPAEDEPDITIAKVTTSDGLAVLDQWSLKTRGVKAGPETTRKIAMLVYTMGQAVGAGHIQHRLAEKQLSDLFPPEVEFEKDEREKLGLAPAIAKWPGTLDQLKEILVSGVHHPKAPFEEVSASAMTRPKRWKLGDDRELGQDLAVKLGGNSADHRRAEGAPLTAVYDRGSTYKVDQTGAWRALQEHEVSKLAARYSGTYVDTSTPKNPNACAPVKLSQGRIEAIRKVAEMYLTQPGYFDEAPAGLACRAVNGPVFITINDGGIGGTIPLSAEHRVRANQVIPVSYDAKADCPMFAQFLDDLFPDVSEDERRGRQTCILQYFGAALLGLGPKYQKALILNGEGANGKSTLLNIMAKLFPAEGVVAIPMQAFFEDYKAAMLADAKVNICNELPSRELIDGDKVKGIISGDEITARNPYEKAFTFRPRATHVFACNRLPATNDLSAGFFRRFTIIDFPACFLGREDTGLADRIVAAELPGILAWAIEGAALLIKQGRYTVPDSAVEAEAIWRRNSDSVSMWLNERTERTGWTTASSAHVSYKIWCERALLKPVSTKEFSYRMKAAKVSEKHPKNVTQWGITVKAEAAFSHDALVLDN